jgi:hypothetical protein
VVNAHDHHQRWLSDAANGLAEVRAAMITHRVPDQVAVGRSGRIATASGRLDRSNRDAISLSIVRETVGRPRSVTDPPY